MIRHTVMLKVIKSNEFDQLREELRIRLMALIEKIEEIKFFEVGLNFSDSPNAYDVVLISDFNSVDDLKKYAQHPEHLKVIDFIKTITSDRKVVDFETD